MALLGQTYDLVFIHFAVFEQMILQNKVLNFER